MLAGALVALVVVAGPGDGKKELSEAAKKLRVAWASQYEWREDGLKNVTLTFEWERKRVDKNDDERISNGTGQAVVVGNRIVRIHVDGGLGSDRREAAAGVRWVLGRYVREPFDEHFKDAEIKDEGKSLSGADKVSAFGTTYYLSNDRIIAEVRDFGTPKKPRELRVDFKLDDMGDGYARIREFYVRKGDSGRKLTTSRELKARKGGDAPMPKGYAFSEEPKDGGTVNLWIEFTEPQVDGDAPVAMDKKAEQILREAWLNRYVLPEQIRIVADFERKPDSALLKRWWSKVEGELQVWGMSSIQIELAEEDNNSGRGRGRRNRGGQNRRAGIHATCLNHFREAFGLMRDTPFETEFADCGFVLAEEKGKQVIHVYGHAREVARMELEERLDALRKAEKKDEAKKAAEALAAHWTRTVMSSYLVENGFITGFRKAGDRENWIYLKLKKNRSGKGVIQRLTTTAEAAKLSAKWRYQRTRGIQVPKLIEMLVTPSFEGGAMGVCAYSLRKLKVTVPDG